MSLNPSGAISLGGPVTGQSIAITLSLSPTATISLNQTNVRALAGVPSGAITMPTNFWGKSAFTPTQRAIFGFGAFANGAVTNVTNLISNTGVIAADTPGVGQVRRGIAGTGYGGDRAMFALGSFPNPPIGEQRVPTVNLVSNTGVVASDTPSVGTARTNVGATGYGGDRAIYAFGIAAGYTNISNLVSNTGVIASDTPGVGTARANVTGVGYGGQGQRGIFGFGFVITPFTGSVAISNLVSDTGVIASDVNFVSTTRAGVAATGYGGDRALFVYGQRTPAPPAGIWPLAQNLVSNTGVIANNTSTVGPSRSAVAGAIYGADRGVIAFGRTGPSPAFGTTNAVNLVSNTGVVAAATTGTGNPRSELGAAGYSFT